jgi:peptide/nickel transport system substrate-binding protein
MTQKRKITRREFLHLSTMAAVGAVSAACAAAPATEAPTEAPPTEAPPTEAPPTEAPPTEAPPAEVPTEVPTEAPPAAAGGEAPMLADLVAKGELPPLAERLPTVPLVLAGRAGVGNYGGTIRRGFKGVSDRWGPTKMHDQFFAWFDEDLNLYPFILESWEINDDASEWTFHLRPGTKWSDGVELTTGDIQWWYENQMLNKDLFPSVYIKWTTGTDKVPLTFEAVDKYTFKMKFIEGKPLFLYDLTRGTGMEAFGVGCLSPSHYMKQFHKDFADDPAALEAAAKEAGFESWAQYYLESQDYWYMNPERPVLSAWRAKNRLSEELFVMERNPYFFAVDPEGNQLPYVDQIQHRLFEADEVFNLWITNGEIDFQGRRVAMANYTLYKEAEAAGDYQVYISNTANHVAIQCNLTTKNERLREFFNERNVRIALSLAVNRDEMNELVYNGLYTPRQYSPMEQSPQYYPKLSEAYIEYNPDEANRLLDEAGYAEKDAEGFRLWKDGSGETLSFIIEGTAEAGTPDEDAAQLAVKYFADVGVKATYKYAERSLYTEHFTANDIEAAWWGGDRTLLPLAPLAVIFRGYQTDRPWACAWGIWLQDPGNPTSEKPPEGHWIWDIWNTWDEVAREVDPQKQTDMFYKILDIWAEELPMIGFLGQQPSPVIVKNGFMGYLEGMPQDDTIGDENYLVPATHYWDDPAKHTV